MREADDLFEKYLEPAFRARAPKIEKVPNGQLLFRLEGERHHRRPDESPFRVKDDGSPVNEHRHLATDPKDRLKAMDRDGIERGLCFRRRIVSAVVQEDAYAAALCRAYNIGSRLLRGGSQTLMGVGVFQYKRAVAMTKPSAPSMSFFSTARGIFVGPIR